MAIREQADVLKLHKRSGKLTLLHYEDFKCARYPRLLTRIKVALRNQFVQVFDHSIDPDPQLAVNKERFLRSSESVESSTQSGEQIYSPNDLRIGVKRSRLPDLGAGR